MVVACNLHAADGRQGVLGDGLDANALAGVVNEGDGSLLRNVAVDEEHHVACLQPSLVHLCEFLVIEAVKAVLCMLALKRVIKDNIVQVLRGQAESLVEIKVLHVLQSFFLNLIKDTFEVRRAHRDNALERFLHVDRKSIGIARPVELHVVVKQGHCETQLGAIGHVFELSHVLFETPLPHLCENTRLDSRAKAVIVRVNFDCNVTLGLTESVVLLEPEVGVVPLLCVDRSC